MAEASPRVRIALAWIDAFTNWNLSAIYSFVTQSSDFEYGYLPASAGIAPKSMVDWMIYNKVHKEVLPDFKVCPGIFSLITILIKGQVRSQGVFWVQRANHSSSMYLALRDRYGQMTWWISIDNRQSDIKHGSTIPARVYHVHPYSTRTWRVEDKQGWGIPRYGFCEGFLRCWAIEKNRKEKGQWRYAEEGRQG